MAHGAQRLHLIQNKKPFYLVAGDKSGINQKRFYKQLIKKADERFTEHLKKLKGKSNE